MLNIDSLITTYSGMLETLKEIRKKEEELKTIDTVKQELKKSKQECEELKKEIKWNKKHINILSNYL
jgi:flagellar motility protein MotE (MotC chaperone)